MASKLFQAIRGIARTSEFETYYETVQLLSVAGAPTVDEAKKDYQALLGTKATAFVG